MQQSHFRAHSRVGSCKIEFLDGLVGPESKNAGRKILKFNLHATSFVAIIWHSETGLHVLATSVNNGTSLKQIMIASKL